MRKTAIPHRLHTLATLLLMLLGGLAATSCIDEEQFDDTPQGNLEALWRIIDEHYCFFEEKGVDWNAVHEQYSRQMNSHMTAAQQLEVMTNMLAELRDGHVNLYTSFDIGRYWKWHEDYPSNISDTLISKYLGTDYRIAAGMRYRVLDDNIAYLRCPTFTNTIGSSNLDDILLYLAPCNGLIIDLRDNGGGLLTTAETLASRFTNKKILVGYMRHKTGKGHDDFSSMQAQWLRPSSGLRWQKGVVVLTNRQVYSAANEFVKYMKRCPGVKVVGDHTGGGAGMPFSSELPNGWSVRFSACPMYDADGNSTENGIAPDYDVALADADFAQGRDTIIEFARRLLRE